MDPVTVQSEMRRQGLLSRDGYPTMELVRMVEAVPVPAATADYAAAPRMVEPSSLPSCVRTREVWWMRDP